MVTSVKTFNVLGVSVSAMDLNVASHAILRACEERRKGYVCVTGVHGISEAQRDPRLRLILQRAFLNTTDGMPLVWLGRMHVGRWVDRVYGPDLMEHVFRATRDGRFSHFLCGGVAGVAEELKAALERRFPGVRVVGTYSPPFRPMSAHERAEFKSLVSMARPDMIWVGLSTPKQERFMAEYLDVLDCTIMLGVGAAFDFLSGRVVQAPRWVQRSGFEWLYRIRQDPRRLWKRYAVNNPLFLGRIILQLTGLKRYPLPEPMNGEGL